MQTTAIHNTEDVIDSRDVIERIEELESEQAELVQKLSDGEITEAEMREFDADEGMELDSLRSLAEQCEGYGDWQYGEQVIRRSYFVDYTKQLIDDCYQMPKDLNSGKWPYCHMKMDYEAAAEHLEQDYISVDFNGVEYLIRCV